MSASEPVTASFLSTNERGVSTDVYAGHALNKHFHLLMLTMCATLLAVILIGSPLMRSWRFSDLFAILIALPVFFVPALIWHDRRKFHKRDAALTIPWVLALIILIPPVVEISARLRFPLHDSALVGMDHVFGLSVAQCVSWASAHPAIGSVLSRSYGLLFFLMAAAALIPALTGRNNTAEEFVLANAIAFLLALPVFSVFPAVGPWTTEHFASTETQRICERAIVALHGSISAGSPKIAGLVTFPSFHVIWAVLSARALWSVKLLRLSSAVLGVMIALSTVTTGWHYVSDVIGGIVFAVVSLMLVSWLIQKHASAL